MHFWEGEGAFAMQKNVAVDLSFEQMSERPFKIQTRGGGGAGGSKAFWHFTENAQRFGDRDVPKADLV